MSKTDASNKRKNRIYSWWLDQTLRNKLNIVTVLGLIIVLMSVLIDVWTIKISIFDFSTSLSGNEKVVNALQAIENEYTALKNYVRNDLPSDEFLAVAHKTEKAVKELPTDYYELGAERLGWTQRVKNAYSVYQRKRTDFLLMDPDAEDYLTKEYELYEMLDYLKSYSSTLMSQTTVATGNFYKEKFPKLAAFPAIIIVCAFFMILVIIVLTNAVYKSLIDPLLKLSNAAHRIANNDIFIEDVEVDTRDEIGELVHAFNTMKFATGNYITTMEDNRIALDKLHAEELKKKEVENRLDKMKFEALRHQINPHFLFNTLNVISGMARLEDANTTDKMIKALSSLFRYTLRTDDKESRVEQEITVIKDYMYLQSMRFGERIKYEIDCDPEVLDAYIPSFTVQPLVENSIVHGLGPKEEGGMITIKAFKSGEEKERLIITISDTGVGMNKEALEALRAHLLDGDTDIHKSIGIGNIYRRLTLMYPESTFDIESCENRGTTVTIGVPFTRVYEE